MKKITLLLVLLVCSLGFAQQGTPKSYSDLSSSSDKTSITTAGTEARTKVSQTISIPIPDFGGNEYTVHVFDTGFGDEVSWELRDANAMVLLSVADGTYGLGYDDTQMVNVNPVDEPLEFYIESMGTFGDNTPNYEIICGGSVIVSGQLAGGTDTTESGITCGGGGGPNEFTVHVFDTGFGDEVSWELRDNAATVLLSVVDGTYGLGYDDTQMVTTANEPLEFYIESMGTFGDNTPNYEVSCGGSVIVSGQLAGGTETTETGIMCATGGGGTTTFTTLNDFNNACIGSGNLTMEDFQGALIAPNSVQACGTVISSAGDGTCYNPGEVEVGFEITSSGTTPTTDQTVTAGEGFGGINPNDVIAGANTFAEYTIIDFTGTADVTSGGFEIYNFFGGSPTEVRLFDAGGMALETFSVPFGQGFFAFIAEEPISRIEVEAGAGDGELLANFFFGACASNDVCNGAIAMDCGDVETGDTTEYANNGGSNASPDAWYSYTGSGDPEFITFSLCDGGTTYDSLLTVFDSCGGTQIAGNDDACGLQSEVSFLSDGTTTYYVAVEGFGTNAGPFSLEVTCNPVAANDLCDDAIAVACGDVVMGSTSFATLDTGAANCDDTFDPTPFNPTVDVTAPGVWYTYTESIPGFIQDITVDLCDSADFDTKISVYSGDCGTLTCVAANDDNDACSGFTSTVEFQSDGISTYYILVHGFGTQTGDFTLSFDCAPVAPPNDMIANSIDVDEIGFPYTDPAVNMPGATTEAGTPADCDNAGVQGVWYNFVPEMSGEATATVTSPAGYTSVTFYTADTEDSVETDLTLVDYFDNQCVPGADASILVTAGQVYYVYVANTMGVTDIVIDGDFYLGTGDTEIAGFNYYPNPATDQLNLSSGTGTIESAVMYNILGQEVLSREVGSSNAQLNVSNLTVGTYILKVVVDGELGIYKIVKQ